MTADPAWLTRARAEGRILSETGVRAGAIAPSTPEREKAAVPTPGTHRIEILLWKPCALNKLLYARNWAIREKLKKADAKVVADCASLHQTPPCTGKRRVSLEIVLQGRQQEADIDAYLKTVLDALVNCGMLIDDKAKFVEWGGVKYTRGPAQWGQTTVPWGTAIVLEDI